MKYLILLLFLIPFVSAYDNVVFFPQSIASVNTEINSESLASNFSRLGITFYFKVDPTTTVDTYDTPEEFAARGGGQKIENLSDYTFTYGEQEYNIPTSRLIFPTQECLPEETRVEWNEEKVYCVTCNGKVGISEDGRIYCNACPSGLKYSNGQCVKKTMTEYKDSFTRLYEDYIKPYLDNQIVIFLLITVFVLLMVFKGGKKSNR